MSNSTNKLDVSALKVKPADTEVTATEGRIRDLIANPVTATEFLDTLYGSRAGDAWVCAISKMDVPKEGPERDEFNRELFGGRANRYNLPAFATTHTLYYSTGIPRTEARASRKSSCWDYSTAFVLDDCVEKGDLDKMRAILGSPSFVVQTSAGSFQAGWLLTAPIRNGKLFKTAMQACTLAFYERGPNGEPPDDPGHGGLGRYMRMPLSVNNKGKRYVDGRPFPVRATEWRPHLRYDFDVLKAALSDVWAEAETLTPNAGTSGGGGTLAVEEITKYCKTDLLMAGLDALGMVHGPQGDGFTHCTCPKEALHGSKLDDRTGYNPRTKVFKCQHTTHGELTRDDVLAWLEQEHGPEAWARIVADVRAVNRQALIDALLANPVPEDENYTPPSTSTEPAPRRKGRLVSFAPDAAEETLYARETINAYFCRGETTLVLAQPATGKTGLAITLTMAITANRPDLVGEKEFGNLGAVIYVSGEGGGGAIRRRRKGWLIRHKLEGATFPHEPMFYEQPGFKLVRSADGRGGHIQFTEDANDLSAEIERLRAGGIEVCLVLFDTMNACFDGVPENSNEAVGAAFGLIEQFSTKHDVAVGVFHHMPKTAGRSGGGGDMASSRGASAAYAAARNVITLTELADEKKAKLPRNERDHVVQLDGAKCNEGLWAPRQYFLRDSATLMVTDKRRDIIVPQPVPVIVPYKANFGWKPDGENERLEVMAALAAAMAAGTPLRTRGDKRSETQKAADVLAERFGEPTKLVSETITALQAEGLIEIADSAPNAKGDTYKAWLLSEAGEEWLRQKQESVLLGTEDEAAE